MVIDASCVIDASVGVKCLRGSEELSDRALALLAREMRGRPERITPGLFDIECSHAVAQSHRRGSLSTADALEALQLLHDLPIVRLSTRPLVFHAGRLALEHRIGAYDAVYVALAVLFDVPLVSADERLVRAMAGTPCQVVSLADVEV